MEFTGFCLRSIRSANSIEYVKGAIEQIEQAPELNEMDRQMLLNEAQKKISSLQTVGTYEETGDVPLVYPHVHA